MTQSTQTTFATPGILNHDKLKIMLEMQDKLNQVVHPQWREQGYNWTRAIMVEGVEALDHYGWKWWKKQECNKPQVRIELTDIWHFIMSHELERMSSHEMAREKIKHHIYREYDWDINSVDVPSFFDKLIAGAACGRIDYHAFISLMRIVELTWDQLYDIYIAKNVLNLFRQANGYKEGTYIKMWRGKEDNEALDAIMKINPGITPDELQVQLTRVYALARVHHDSAVK